MSCLRETFPPTKKWSRCHPARPQHMSLDVSWTPLLAPYDIFDQQGPLGAEEEGPCVVTMAYGGPHTLAAGPRRRRLHTLGLETWVFTHRKPNDGSSIIGLILTIGAWVSPLSGVFMLQTPITGATTGQSPRGDGACRSIQSTKARVV